MLGEAVVGLLLGDAVVGEDDGLAEAAVGLLLGDAVVGEDDGLVVGDSEGIGPRE